MNRRLFLSSLVLGTGSLVGALSGYRFGARFPALALGSDAFSTAIRRTPPDPTPEPLEPQPGPAPLSLVFHPSYLLYSGPSVGSVKEGPQRLEAIMARIRKTPGLNALPMYLPLPAAPAQLERVHTHDYVAYVQQQPVLPQNERAFLRTFDAQTKRSGIHFLPGNVTPASLLRPYQAASLSAGGALMAVDLVMSGQSRHAFALMRPPGHHAKADGYRGFCVFNNAAVAVRHAQAAYGAKRVMIVDWDVHHGNGTQSIFDSDADVLFFSVHQAGIYPRTGHMTEHGRGKALGKTINVPLPGGLGDGAYRAVFEQIVAPVARAFKPDLILVSAGQDAHAGEHLAQMRLSDHGYAHMAGLVKDLADELCGGKLVLLLEGGYNPDTAASSVCAILQVLSGGPPLAGRPAVDPTPASVVQRHVARVKTVQRPFWPQLAKVWERG